MCAAKKNAPEARLRFGTGIERAKCAGIVPRELVPNSIWEGARLCRFPTHVHMFW